MMSLMEGYGRHIRTILQMVAAGKTPPEDDETLANQLIIRLNRDLDAGTKA